jgi:hypothetical protein
LIGITSERLFWMSRNIGALDRMLRIVAGIVLIAMVFVGPQTPWGWIGLVPLVTALIGWCPAYRLVGLSTCPASRRT